MSRAAVISFLFVICLALAFPLASSLADEPTDAPEGLPQEVVRSIENAGRSGQNPNYALSAAVIAALTYHPAHVEEIIARAVIADPRSYKLVVADATRSFPRFANRIKNGADGVFLPPHPPLPELQSRIGLLSCESIPGTRWNFLITSSVDIACVFEAAGGTERYQGETGIAFGVDIQFKTKERFGFAVFGLGPTYSVGSYQMTGKYVGAKISASAGVGVGAAALAGGGKGNFTLEPLVLEGNIGLGASAGLGYLYLEPATP